MDEVKVVQLDTTPAQTSVKQLRTEMKALKDAMAGMEEGSDAFLEAANKAGTLKHQIDEINQSVNGASADFGDMLGNVTKASAGIVGGFQAANAALSLFGVESEEVTKSIKKMQDSMAIVQGLTSIDAGIKALAKLRNSITATTGAAKLLKAALTPKSILALTVAITALVAIWNKFGDSIEKALPFITEIKNAFKDTKKSAAEAEEAQKSYLKSVAEAQGKVDEYYKKQSISNLNEQAKKEYDELSKAVEGYNLQIEAKVAEQKKEGISQQNWQKLQDEALVIEQKRHDATVRMNEILSSSTSYVKEDTEATKARNKAIDEYIEKLQLQQAIYKALYGGDEEKPLVVKKPELPEEEEEEEDTSAADAILERVKAHAEAYKQIELSAVETFNQIENDLELAHKYGLLKDEEYTAATKKLADERAAYQKQKNLETVSTVMSMASSMSSILSSIASTEDRQSEDSLKRYKAMQTAAATINMLVGITAAISGLFTTKSGPWDIALAAIQAAAIAAAGAANIHQIQNTELGGSPLAGVANTAGAALATTIIPPVQYSAAVQGAAIEQTVGSQNQYVAVTEIQRVGEKVNVAETEARY